MENTQDVHLVSLDVVRNDIRIFLHEQLACAEHSSRPADIWLPRQRVHFKIYQIIDV